MLERFAGWLVGRMLASQAFPKEDAPLVSFGIVQGLRTLIEIILLLCTGLFMNLFYAFKNTYSFLFNSLFFKSFFI